MKYDLKIRDSFGNLLEVLQTLPEKGLKFPTIIMVPGFGMDLHEYGYFDQLSDALIKNGFQTFRFSFEGTGNSEGNFVDMTIDKQAQQLKDVINYVVKDRFTNTRKIGFMAQSFGASTVIPSLPYPKIKTFVFTSAPSDPYGTLSRYFKGQRGFDPEGMSVVEGADKRKTRIGPQFWTSLTKHDFPEKIAKLKNSILFIYGTKDKRIKRYEIEKYYEQVKSPKKLIVIEEADHGFTGKFRQTVIKLVTEWFLEELM